MPTLNTLDQAFEIKSRKNLESYSEALKNTFGLTEDFLYSRLPTHNMLVIKYRKAKTLIDKIDEYINLENPYYTHHQMIGRNGLNALHQDKLYHDVNAALEDFKKEFDTAVTWLNINSTIEKRLFANEMYPKEFKAITDKHSDAIAKTIALFKDSGSSWLSFFSNNPNDLSAEIVQELIRINANENLSEENKINMASTYIEFLKANMLAANHFDLNAGSESPLLVKMNYALQMLLIKPAKKEVKILESNKNSL